MKCIREVVISEAEVRNMVAISSIQQEKPRREDAPSDLSIICRYRLTPDVSQAEQRSKSGPRQEDQLTQGLRCSSKEEPVYACCVKGTRYDVGEKIDYLIAMADFGLEKDGLGPDSRNCARGLQL